MKRITALSICLAALVLTGCSKGTPTSASTPAPTTVTTSPAGSSLGGVSSIGEPTTSTTGTPVTTYTVQRGTIEDILQFSGQIAPVQYPMSFAQDGVIQKIFVKPGQTIKEGDLIAQLDIQDLESQIVQAQLTLQQAQQAINQATQLSLLEVKQAEIALEAAQQDLEKTKEPPSAVEITQAQSAVREAQANLDTTRNNASQAKNQAKADMDKAVVELQNLQEQYSAALLKLQQAEGDVAKELQQQVADLQKQMLAAEAAVASAVINYDTARNNERASVSDAEAKLDLAKAQLTALLKGADKFVIAEKERAVRSAEIALEQARQRAQPDPSLKNAVESGRLQIKQLEEQVAARQLIAPISGDIVTINVSIGDPITIGSPILTILDRSRLEIVTNSADMLTEDRTSLPQLTGCQLG
ncbi:MAG: biotin/lipoyl-binding protein, partial [Oscillochloris sp.]|nr:biotin/lipoyl-binding protein [Oscillochloris sp.]